MLKGYYTKVALKCVGSVWIARTGRGICRIELNCRKNYFMKKLSANMEWIEDTDKFRGIISKLKKFTSGRMVKFAKPLDIQNGTPFQKQVWEKIATISHGDTKSYAWIACAIGKPSAYRAVANACGANPVPIIIPCHRVIASDGSIGGFSAGTKLKLRLLRLENS